jgi:hypothetical protein
LRVEHEYFRTGALPYLAAWDAHRAKLQREADQSRSPSADAIPQHPEQGAEQRAPEQRDGDEQALLGIGQVELLAQERRERSTQHPTP